MNKESKTFVLNVKTIKDLERLSKFEYDKSEDEIIDFLVRKEINRINNIVEQAAKFKNQKS